MPRAFFPRVAIGCRLLGGVLVGGYMRWYILNRRYGIWRIFIQICGSNPSGWLPWYCTQLQPHIWCWELDRLYLYIRYVWTMVLCRYGCCYHGTVVLRLCCAGDLSSTTFRVQFRYRRSMQRRPNIEGRNFIAQGSSVNTSIVIARICSSYDTNVDFDWLVIAEGSVRYGESFGRTKDEMGDQTQKKNGNIWCYLVKHKITLGRACAEWMTAQCHDQY